MTATSVEQCVAFDGLIRPDMIPGATSSDNSGGQLNAAAITDACVGIRGVASKVRAGVAEVSSAWMPLPEVFQMPGAQPVHRAMDAPGTSLTTFASTMDQMARALEDFAGEIEPLRRAFDDVRGRAQAFVDSLEPGNRVWMRATSTTEYQWDGNASAHATSAYSTGMGGAGIEPYSVWDAAAYLRGRGETARVSGGSVEILVSWLESGEHVGRNNDLMDEVADLYARLHAAEVDCANRINALREDVCVAPLEAVEAWQLKQDGVELPWGAKVEEKRNCGEQVGHGFYEFGTGTVEGLGSLISYNPMKGEWGDWDHAGQSWAGIGDVVVSVSTLGGGAIGMINVAINGPSAYTDSLDTVTEVGKSLVAWDTWEDAPAQALTESVLNIGTAFIPVGGWAAASAKGLSAAAGATRITSALTKLERLGPAVMARLMPDSFRIDVDSPRIDIDAPTMRVDADAPTLRPDADAPRVDADGPTTPGGGAVDDAVRAGDDAGPGDGLGKADDAPGTPGGGAADDGVRAGDHTGTPDSDGTAEDAVRTGENADPADGGGSNDGAPAPQTPTGSPISDWIDQGTDPIHSGLAESPGEWTRVPDDPITPKDLHYGEPMAEGGGASTMPVQPTHQSGFDLRTDTDHAHAYGFDAQGNPLSRAEYEARYVFAATNHDNYPPNGGATRGTRIEYSDINAFTRDYGDQLDRIGHPGGSYLGLRPDGIPSSFEERGLPLGSLAKEYTMYQFSGSLPDGFKVQISEIAPAFGQPGGGIQVVVTDVSGKGLSVKDLIRLQVLSEVASTVAR